MMAEKKKASKPLNDLTGKRFGRLTVAKYVGSSKWLCQCDCGNEKIVRTHSLNSGETKSCGCLDLEKIHEKKRNFVDCTGKRFGELEVIE